MPDRPAAYEDVPVAEQRRDSVIWSLLWADSVRPAQPVFESFVPPLGP